MTTLALARCRCPECLALDAAHPGEGHQLAAEFPNLKRVGRPVAAGRPVFPASMEKAVSVTTMTWGELCLSPYNVRTNAKDAAATEGLEASIKERGLLYPLVVHPIAGKKGKSSFGVLAGGRRYRAIGKLIEAKALPADWPIDVIVRDFGEAELI